MAPTPVSESKESHSWSWEKRLAASGSEHGQLQDSKRVECRRRRTGRTDDGAGEDGRRSNEAGSLSGLTGEGAGERGGGGAEGEHLVDL